MSYSLADFTVLTAPQKAVLTLLALTGTSLGKSALLEAMRKTGVNIDAKAVDNKSITTLLHTMNDKKLIQVSDNYGAVKYTLKKDWLNWPIHAAIIEHTFEAYGIALRDSHVMLASNYYYHLSLEQYIAHLRIALLRAENPKIVHNWLDKCAQVVDKKVLSRAYEVAMGPIYHAEWLARLHPDMVQEVMASLLQGVKFSEHFSQADFLCQWSLSYIAHTPIKKLGADFVLHLIEVLLLMGRLNEAEALIKNNDYAENSSGSAVFIAW